MQTSVVVIDSRSDVHRDWVQTCLDSIANQTTQVELIVVNNVGREKTIGECWNEGVRGATGDWVFFVGDDSWLARDCVQVMEEFTDTKAVNITTYMTIFEDETGFRQTLNRHCTGMFRRDYLLKHPFNEKLKKGVDREYLEELRKRGNTIRCIDHYFGHYDRKHSDYSCAGDIEFVISPTDIYVLASGGRSFIDPIVKRLDSVHISSTFDPVMADGAKVIICEWADTKMATEIADYKCNAKKILRLHSYEAFTTAIYYIDFSKYDVVIFVAKHIKDFVESKIGKIPNAVIIPVGVSINGYDVSNKKRNNKIAYAGEISRKKGIGELLFIAENLSDYEFHIAGKFNEEDVARHLNEKQPDNVFIESYSYDLPKFFEDKTYFINTSLREGNPITVLQAMSHGLKPLVKNWVGADDIYNGNTYSNIDELKNLLQESYEPEKYRKFVADNYDFENTYKQIKKLLEVKDGKVII